MKDIAPVTALFLLLAVPVQAQLYYQRVTGAANDIGIGANDAVWIIGYDDLPGNEPVYRWAGATFVTDGSADGVSIAVGPDGLPWLTNYSGEIYRRSLVGTWTKLPGRGIDIGVGADGSVWLVGWKANLNDLGYPTSDGPVYRWTGATWENWGGGARRIAVDNTGWPWVTNLDGDIYRMLPGGTWQLMPGAASDIAAGADGSIWIVGYDRLGGDEEIYVWQSGNWVKQNGTGARRVSVSAGGLPWLVNDAGEIYRALPLTAPVINPTQLVLTNGVMSVLVATQPGLRYSLEGRAAVDSGSFIAHETVTGDGTLKTLHDSSATNSMRFYRVTVSQ